MLGSRGGRAVRAMVVIALTAALAAPHALGAADVVLTGTPGNDAIAGTDASEAIYGDAGADSLAGNGGDDELDGGPGPDVLAGGSGSDVVSYVGAAPVRVSLDGVADDGAAGEGDDVRPDVEDVFGGEGDDKLTGSAAGNTIDGGAGDDTIDGGAGVDTLLGGDGSDTVTARDGRADAIDCGPGVDAAILDTVDVATGCERQAFPPTTPPLRLSKLFPDGARIESLVLAGVLRGSSVVIACRTGCRPATSLQRPLLRAKRVRPRAGGVKLSFGARARLVAGTVFEIGVTAPRAQPRCTVFQLSDPLRSVRPVRTRCISVARGRSG